VRGKIGFGFLGAAFPLSLSPAAWYKPESLSALANSDPVATWPDSSGNGRDLTQATSGARPLYKTNVQNGRPAVRMDGSNDYLAYLPGSSWATTTSLTVVAALRRIAPVSQSALMVLRNSGVDDAVAPDGALIGWEGVNDRLAEYRNSVQTANIMGDIGSAAMVQSHVWDGTNNTIYRDGTASTPVASTGSFVLREIYVGCRYTTSTQTYFNNYDYYEILVFPSALSATNRTSVETYLRGRWGTP
jgi:hypothetical protein